MTTDVLASADASWDDAVRELRARGGVMRVILSGCRLMYCIMNGDVAILILNYSALQNSQNIIQSNVDPRNGMEAEEFIKNSLITVNDELIRECCMHSTVPVINQPG